MRLVKPSVEFIWCTRNPLITIERAGRTCYKSEANITKDSAEEFVRKLIKSGHEAMIEHASASYRVICDRGITHEIVRHRLFSFAQESTRYCSYKSGVTFIIPIWLYDQIELTEEGKMKEVKPGNESAAMWWVNSMASAEMRYQDLINVHNWTPQQARTVLPNSLKTEIVMTGNFREWRHFFSLRCAEGSHPQMKEVADMIMGDFEERMPVIVEGMTNAKP